MHNKYPGRVIHNDLINPCQKPIAFPRVEGEFCLFDESIYARVDRGRFSDLGGADALWKKRVKALKGSVNPHNHSPSLTCICEKYLVFSLKR